jgi:adenylate cyclase
MRLGSTALATERVERRLAAILAADVAGYSRLIGADEGGTLQAFKTLRSDLFEPTVATHNGRLVKTTGQVACRVSAMSLTPRRQATEVQTRMGRGQSVRG